MEKSSSAVDDCMANKTCGLVKGLTNKSLDVLHLQEVFQIQRSGPELS